MTALACALLSLVLVLTAVWRAGERYAALYARQSAATIAQYLAVVTPPARARPSGYDLATLLVQARGLATLPGLGVEVEVYHGTAPLVRATAPSLSPDALDEIRRRDTPSWWTGLAFAPLWDKGDREVVGAVAARPRGFGTALLSLWLLAGLMTAAAAASRAAGAVGERTRSPLAHYVAGSLALGLGAYLAVRSAAARSTDRWLADSRILLQDVAARAPRGRVPFADLTRVVRGATLTPAAPASVAPRRATSERGREAVQAVRLSAGRWLELRATAEDARTHDWLVLLAALALFGPGSVAVVHWAAAAVARPRELRTTAAAWGFLAPAGVYIALFVFAPLLFGSYLALHSWSPGDPIARFVGLENFTDLARDTAVRSALLNTALFALSVPIAMAFALPAAFVLRGQGHGARLARTLLLLPAAMSVVALGLFWRWVYHPDFGVLSGLLVRAGLPPIDWLHDPRTALPVLIAVAAWAQIGYQTALFVAGLQAIPTAYLDAARAEGAGAWRRFRHITLPLLRPVMLFGFVTGIIGTVQMFTLIYVMMAGAPVGGATTDVIAVRLYDTAWQSLRMGRAAALGVMLGGILLIVTWGQLRLLRRATDHV